MIRQIPVVINTESTFEIDSVEMRMFLSMRELYRELIPEVTHHFDNMIARFLDANLLEMKYYDGETEIAKENIEDYLKDKMDSIQNNTSIEPEI